MVGTRIADGSECFSVIVTVPNASSRSVPSTHDKSQDFYPKQTALLILTYAGLHCIATSWTMGKLNQCSMRWYVERELKPHPAPKEPAQPVGRQWWRSVAPASCTIGRIPVDETVIRGGRTRRHGIGSGKAYSPQNAARSAIRHQTARSIDLTLRLRPASLSKCSILQCRMRSGYRGGRFRAISSGSLRAGV